MMVTLTNGQREEKGSNDTEDNISLPGEITKTQSTSINSAELANNVDLSDTDTEPDVNHKTCPPQELMKSSYIGFSPYIQMEPSYNQFLYTQTKVQVDAFMVSLTLLSMFFHLILLTKPNYPFFNEKRYLDNLRHYSERMFYLDADPPLFIILLHAMVKFLQFDIMPSNEILMADQTVSFYLRILPALFSSFITPLVYSIMDQLNFSKLSSVLISMCVICNSFIVTDARHVSPTSMFIFLTLIAILFAIKACNSLEQPFTKQWWGAHVGVGISLGLAISTLHIGFNTYLFITLLILVRAWNRFGLTTVCEVKLWAEFLAKFLMVVLLPLVIYLVFYCVLVVQCHKTGPSDAQVSPRYQYTLENNMASHHNDSLQWVYDKSMVSLKTEDPKSCYLHSHPFMYEGHENQQQVTCYEFEDENNWWTVESVTAWQTGGEPYYVRHEDTVRFKHSETGGYLALNETQPCLSNPAGLMVAVVPEKDDHSTVWKIDILAGAGPYGLWAVGDTTVRLINKNNFLVMAGEPLPEWGFNQQDMAGSSAAAAQWMATETRNDFDSLIKSITVDRINVLGKVFEIHYNLFVSGKYEKIDHKHYDSSPYTWLKPGLFIVYSYQNQQLIVSQGNTCLEFSMLFSALCYFVTLGVLLVRRCRQFYDVPEVAWDGLCKVLWFFMLGFVTHYFPFFFQQRPLFIYQFQLSYIWLCMGCCAYIDIMACLCGRYVKCIVVALGVWVLCLFGAFVQNFPYCVGAHVEQEDLVWVY